MIEGESLQPKKCPVNHVPACTAWTAVFPKSMTHLIYLQFGFQVIQGANPQQNPVSWTDPFPTDRPHVQLNKMRSWFSLPNAPCHLDCGVYDDPEGNRNWVFFAYWEDYETYQRWTAQPEVAQLWSTPKLDGSFGYWRELSIIPTNHIETIQQADRDHGCMHFLQREVTEVHDYWGAARDRIPAAAMGDFASPLGHTLPNPQMQETRGYQIKVTAPANVCHVRSAQDLIMTGAEQRETYLQKVEPSLRRGMEYILTNPVETGCISCRYIREVTLSGEPLDKTCGTLFFLSLAHLEHWAESHPTHRAIYGMFNQMIEHHSQEELELALWHETSVLPKGHVQAEYVNCSPMTGFLPYFIEEQSKEPITLPVASR